VTPPTSGKAAVEPRWRRLGPDERRAAILAAGIRLFADQPYSTVQVTAVAQEAGVARALVNHYFGTKRELYLEVVRAVMFVPALDEVTLPEGSLRDRIEASVDWLVTILSAHGRTWLTIGVEGAAGDPEVRAILDEADHKAAERVLDAVGSAVPDDARLTTLAAIRAFGGMVKAAVREWVDHEALTQDQVHRVLTATLIAIVESASSP
jgi:AcrR family transcriptional regulator